MKIFWNIALCAVALVMGTTEVEAEASFPMRPTVHATGPGGSVVEHARRVSNARMSGHVVSVVGRCDSACTLYLSMPPSRICLTPGTSFTFHLPYGARADFNNWAADFMMQSYPQWVRSWIHARGGLSHQPLRMDYAYASRFLPTCGDAMAS
jgi:hypothetical protein